MSTFRLFLASSFISIFLGISAIPITYAADAEESRFWKLIEDNLCEFPFMKTVQLERLLGKWKMPVPGEKKVRSNYSRPANPFHLNESYDLAGYLADHDHTRKFQCGDKLVTFQLDHDRIRTLEVCDTGLHSVAPQPGESISGKIKPGMFPDSFLALLKPNLSRLLGLNSWQVSQLMTGKADPDAEKSQSGGGDEVSERIENIYDFEKVVWLHFKYTDGRVREYSIIFSPSYPLHSVPRGKSGLSRSKGARDFAR